MSSITRLGTGGVTPHADLSAAISALSGGSDLQSEQVAGEGGGIGALVEGFDGVLSVLHLDLAKLTNTKFPVVALNAGDAPTWGANGPAFASATALKWWNLGAAAMTLKAALVDVQALFVTAAGTPATDDAVLIGLRDRSTDSVVAHGWSYSGSAWLNVECTGSIGSETLARGSGSGPSALENFWARHHLARPRAALTNHYGGGSPADGNTTSLAYDAGSTTFRTNLADQTDLDLVVAVEVGGGAAQSLRRLKLIFEPVGL